MTLRRAQLVSTLLSLSQSPSQSLSLNPVPLSLSRLGLRSVPFLLLHVLVAMTLSTFQFYKRFASTVCQSVTQTEIDMKAAHTHTHSHTHPHSLTHIHSHTLAHLLAYQWELQAAECNQMLGTFQHVYPVVQSNASLLTEQMTGRNNRVGVRLAFRVPTHTHTHTVS